MRRLSRQLGTAALLLVVAVPAPAADLEEILDCHYQAIGGEAAWQATRSMRLAGTIAFGPDLEAPFTLSLARPGRMRLEYAVEGQTGVEVVDGESAWRSLPASEPQVVVLTPPAARELAERADLEGPLVGYESKGHQVRLLGEGSLDRRTVVTLELTLAGGRRRVFDLDRESCLPVRVVGAARVAGREVEMETRFAGYGQVGELRMPLSIFSRLAGDAQSQLTGGRSGQWPGQRMTIERVEIDVDLPDDLFERPAD